MFKPIFFIIIWSLLLAADIASFDRTASNLVLTLVAVPGLAFNITQLIETLRRKD